jgi:hypothetical protein
MRKTIFMSVAHIALMAICFIGTPMLARGGFTGAERALVIAGMIVSGISTIVMVRHLHRANQKSRREIVRIEKRIAANEAEQRRLLREIIGPRSMQPNIKKRLPRRQ